MRIALPRQNFNDASTMFPRTCSTINGGHPRKTSHNGPNLATSSAAMHVWRKATTLRSGLPLQPLPPPGPDPPHLNTAASHGTCCSSFAVAFTNLVRHCRAKTRLGHSIPGGLLKAQARSTRKNPHSTTACPCHHSQRLRSHDRRISPLLHPNKSRAISARVFYS